MLNRSYVVSLFPCLRVLIPGPFSRLWLFCYLPWPLMIIWIILLPCHCNRCAVVDHACLTTTSDTSVQIPFTWERRAASVAYISKYLQYSLSLPQAKLCTSASTSRWNHVVDFSTHELYGQICVYWCFTSEVPGLYFVPTMADREAGRRRFEEICWQHSIF